MMTNLTNLTTGQMIDRLEMGDVAVNQDGFKVGYNHKSDLLMWSKNEEMPEHSEGNFFSIYFPFIKKDRWVIYPLFISFDEALEAHRTDKKTIVFIHKDREYEFMYGDSEIFQELAKDGVDMKHMKLGKWKIQK